MLCAPVKNDGRDRQRVYGVGGDRDRSVAGFRLHCRGIDSGQNACRATNGPQRFRRMAGAGLEFGWLQTYCSYTTDRCADSVASVNIASKSRAFHRKPRHLRNLSLVSPTPKMTEERFICSRSHSGNTAKLTVALKPLCDHISWLRAQRNALATCDLRSGSGYGVGFHAVDVRRASAEVGRTAKNCRSKLQPYLAVCS